MTDAPSTPEPAADVAAATDPAAVTDEVTAKLQEFGVDETAIGNVKAAGVKTLDELAMLDATELGALGLNLIQAKKLAATFTPATTVVDGAAFDILPTLPDDASWLEALKSGGVLKVDQSTVIASVKVALADRVGLFDIPKKIVTAMETFSETNDEPVDPSFYKLRNELTRRTYADVFAAIPGLDGSFVTEARKTELLRRVDTILWPAILDFNYQLKGWYEAWVQGANNPALLLSVIAGAGSGVGLPPGMMQAPDTGALRDQGDALRDAANKVFAGTGAQIAAGLAYDALQIKKQLEDTRLPALIGAVNRDQMLKQLKVAVPATYPRLEMSIVRFVLGALQAKDQPAGPEELSYFGALYVLGTQITWDQLGGGRGGYTGIGGKL